MPIVASVFAGYKRLIRISFLFFRNWSHANASIQFYAQHEDIVKVKPSTINLIPGNNSYPLELEALGAGNSDVSANSTDDRVKYVFFFLH